MKVYRCGLAVATALLGFALIAQVRPMGRMADWLETPTGGTSLLDPEVVASGHIDGSVWSSDGRRLVCWVSRVALTTKDIEAALTPSSPQAPKITRSIVVWDSETHKNREIWNDTTPQHMVAQCAFMGPTTVLVHFIEFTRDAETGSFQEQHVIALCEAGSGVPRVVFRSPRGAADFSLSISPKQPYAVMHWTANATGQEGVPTPVASIIDRNGNIRQVAIPPQLGGVRSMMSWTPDGSAALFGMIGKDADGKSRMSYYLLDPLSGTFRPTSRESLFAGEGIVRAFEFDETPISFPDVGSDQSSVKITMRLWKRDAPPGSSIPVGVGAARSVELSPQDRHVAYISNGGLVVRTLISVPKDVYARLKKENAKVVAMQNAKQVGLAMIMYATDSDDAFPLASSWQDGITPYTKDTSLLDNFVYSYSGNLNLGSIEKPAETVLGYVQGDGGRAVVYADGHVRWVPDPTK